MTPAQLITAARESAGYTIPEAAAKCGVSQRGWYQLEAGQNGPTLRTLQKMADGLGIPVTALVTSRQKKELAVP